MTTSRIPILHDSYLSGNAFAHGVRMTNDPDLLPLRSLKHSQRIDDRSERIGIQRTKAFVDEKILERDATR